MRFQDCDKVDTKLWYDDINMKNFIPLLYLLLGAIWLYISPTQESALILFVIALIYFVVLGYRKGKRVEVVEQSDPSPEEFHDDFSRVGSADPSAPKISTCSLRRSRK